MGAGGGGGGNQTETITTKYPNYVSDFARAYLSSLGSYIFPGMTTNASYLSGGPNFGQQPAGTPPKNPYPPTPGTFSAMGSQGGQSAGGGSTGSDAGVLSAFADPMISTSPFLQNELAQNPAGMQGALSPAAFNQLAQIYPSLMGSAAGPSAGQGGGGGGQGQGGGGGGTSQPPNSPFPSPFGGKPRPPGFLGGPINWGNRVFSAGNATGGA